VTRAAESKDPVFVWDDNRLEEEFSPQTPWVADCAASADPYPQGCPFLCEPEHGARRPILDAL